MSERLILMSHGAPPDAFERYLALSAPIHDGYAKRCDADFRLHVGNYAGVSPAWNRITLAVAAFRQGYEKIAWLDADTLVVSEDRDIFAETRDDVPLQMIRCNGFPWPQDAEPLWEAFNDGVLVLNRSVETIELLEHVWAQRHATPEPWHIPSMWELNWILDAVKTDESLVAELDVRFNMMAFAENEAITDEAVIRAWHGYPMDERWRAFEAEYERVYGSA